MCLALVVVAAAALGCGGPEAADPGEEAVAATTQAVSSCTSTLVESADPQSCDAGWTFTPACRRPATQRTADPLCKDKKMECLPAHYGTCTWPDVGTVHEIHFAPVNGTCQRPGTLHDVVVQNLSLVPNVSTFAIALTRGPSDALTVQRLDSAKMAKLPKTYPYAYVNLPNGSYASSAVDLASFPGVIVYDLTDIVEPQPNRTMCIANVWVAATRRAGAVCPCAQLTPVWTTCEVQPSLCSPDGRDNWGLTNQAQPKSLLTTLVAAYPNAKAPSCLDCKNIPLSDVSNKLKCLNDSLAYSQDLRTNNRTVAYAEGSKGRLGNDYDSTDQPDTGRCLDRCLKDPHCKSYMFTKNGNGNAGVCQLKNAIPATLPAGSTVMTFSRQAGSIAGLNDSLVIQQLKLVLELAGENMTEAQLLPIRALYYGQPSVAHACSAAPALSNQFAVLQQASYDSTSGVSLRYCEALAQGHVSNVFKAHEFRRCAAMLQTLAQHPGASTDAVQKLSDFLTTLYLQQLQVMTTASDSPAAALGFQLVLLQTWHDAFVSMAARADRVAQLPDAIHNALAEFWFAMHTRTAPTSGILQQLGVSGQTDQTQADLMAAFGQSAAGIYEQVMAQALTLQAGTLYDGLSAPAGTPVTGEMLTMVMGDSLADLMQRVDALIVFHDVSCAITGQCAGDTPENSPLSSYFACVAALSSKDDLNAALTRAAAGLGAWRPAFEAMKDQHDAWLATLTSLAGTRSVVRIYDLRDRAAMRVASFMKSGLFDPAGLNTLKEGMDRAQRSLVMAAAENAHTKLATGLVNYSTGIEKLLASGTQALQYSNAVAHADAIRARQTLELDQLETRKQGLEDAIAAAQADFESVAASFEKIRGSFDRGRLVQVGDASQPIPVPSDSGKFVAGQAVDPPTLAVASTPKLTAGAVLVVDAEGSYSPACAISKVKALSPSGQMDEAHASISAAVTGPEGYRLSFSNSRYKADSNSVADNRNRDITVGAKVEACASVGGGAMWYSFTASACAYSDIHKTWTHAQSEASQDGSDRRTQASFASGLRLENTPYPDLPTGALLVVLQKPGVFDDEIQVLRSGTNTIPIDTQDTVARFVVNDIDGCDNLGSSNLTIAWRQMVGEDEVAQKLVPAMATVIKMMHDDAATLAKQGILLPSQVADERSSAQLALTSLLPHGATIPDAMRILFDAFVDKEILNLDRMVQVESLDDQIELIKKDLETSDLERHQAEASVNLQNLLTNRVVSHMDGDLLREQAVDTMEIVRTEMLPVLQLWYPSALEHVRDSGYLLALRKVDLGMSTYTLADKLSRALEELTAQYDVACRQQERPSIEAPQFIGVAFPRPAPMSGRPAGDLLGQTYVAPMDPIGSFFPTVDGARALNLWEGIAGTGWGTVDVRPQDIIGHGDSRLNCYANVPVIEHIALFVTRDSAQDNATLNQYQRKFDVHASSNQPFVSAQGLRTYQIEDGVWSRYEIPVFYGAPGEFSGLEGATNPRMAEQPPIGLSPFGTFDIDFSELTAILRDGGRTGIDEYASSIVIGLQIGWRQGERLNWVETCPTSAP